MTRIRPLKGEHDAFGQMMWACYKGEDVFEVIERDDGYIDVMNPKGYFSDYKEWHPMEQKAMQFVKGKVLDIGCGAGRHSIYLQKKGVDVLGIDISSFAIKICKLRGLKKAKVMSIEEVDFKLKSFDTIIMMGNNFGLFENFQKSPKVA